MANQNKTIRNRIKEIMPFWRIWCSPNFWISFVLVKCIIKRTHRITTFKDSFEGIDTIRKWNKMCVEKHPDLQKRRIRVIENDL